MTSKPKKSLARGFTLIELIVASGIFAILTLLAFSTLSQTRLVETRAAAIRRIGQTNRFTLETIAREVQLANGRLEMSPIGGVRQAAPAFAILGGGGTTPADDLISHWQIGSELKVVTSDLKNNEWITKRIYRETDIAGNGTIFMDAEICRSQVCQTVTRSALTPEGVNVEELLIRGLDPNRAFGTLNRQPFLEVSLTSVNRESNNQSTEAVRQTLKTVIATRSYQF